MTAFGGESCGEVTLNGRPIIATSFTEDCYVVQQEDAHWPFLTCRETLVYAAQLYLKKSATDVINEVDDLIGKMGLGSCKVSVRVYVCFPKCFPVHRIIVSLPSVHVSHHHSLHNPEYPLREPVCSRTERRAKAASIHRNCFNQTAHPYILRRTDIWP